jgi:2-polyprenyl-6-methoxyphenol hydroxylase-like FAD-dependent oxidoreductase
MRLVDAAGRPEARLKVDRLTRSLGDRYVSILRADLAAMLLGLIADDVELRLGEEVTSLLPIGEKVAAGFRHADRELFDLVIGADGLHSRVRRLAFPGGADWVKPLGYHVAAIITADYPHADDLAYVSRTVPGRQVARYHLRDGRTTLFFIFVDELAKGAHFATASDQKALLGDLFGDVGWESADILKAVAKADEIYFDTVSQVRAPTWNNGRCVLLGDAAYCPSLLAGEGASFALAGAYVLAGELARSGADRLAGVAAYEARLRPFIEQKQRAALGFGAWFAPRTGPGVFMRNQLTRLAGLPGIASWMASRMFEDRLDLPDYAFA